MKLGKSSFETKKGNPFFMAFGIRMGDSWPQSSGAAGDLCTCKKAMGHIQREELLQELFNAKPPSPCVAMHPAACVRALW